MLTPVGVQHELDRRFGTLREKYRAAGMASRVGFGTNPAVIVVDFSNGFTDPVFPLGAELGAELMATRAMLDAARNHGVPVIFLSVSYRADGSDAGPFVTKCPALAGLVQGSSWCDIDSRLERQPEEPLLYKQNASGFIGTDLAVQLAELGVDTLLLAGTSTSGCVRATAVDGCSYGYRVAVVADAVGDRTEDRHWTSLVDLDSKYADAVDLDDVVRYLLSC